MLRHKSVIHVEVMQRKQCTASPEELKKLLHGFLQKSGRFDNLPNTWSEADGLGNLAPYIQQIHIDSEGSFAEDRCLKIHVFELHPFGILIVIIWLMSW